MSLCFRIQNLLLKEEEQLGADADSSIMPIRLDADFTPAHSFGFRVRFASMLCSLLNTRKQGTFTYSQLLFPTREDEMRALGLFGQERFADSTAAAQFQLLQDRFHANEARLVRVDAVLAARQADRERENKARLLTNHFAANLERLQQLVAKAREKRVALADEWETVRIELERDWLHRNNLVVEKQRILGEIARMREEIKQIMARASLPPRPALPKAECEEAAASERAMVITRVLDSTRQISKQRVEIARIQDEVRQIAKELEFSLDQLEQMERETDQVLFAACSTTNNNTTATSGVAVFEFFVEIVERFDALMALEDELLRVALVCWEGQIQKRL